MSDVSIISILGFGFVLGLKHAVEADHVAAVSTIASEHPNIIGSSFVGALWGIGSKGGMMIMSALVGLPARLTAHRFTRTNAIVRGAAAVFSVALGLFITFEIALRG